ncbi:DUF4835 family protein [Paracnuella aquatica]|uniref:type IX secretion system protein PorD n=1 Tax=Paracnuella aquatica TaxID=2268757 RepID=UPI000DEFEEE4|nr:DUF4835 family protein [Paracnuella aquatica]RPD48964.1 DUF4835 family protein [Paracnuella aquatica]
MKKPLILILLLCCMQWAGAQELQARVSVVANRVGSNVDKKIFNTLQTSLFNFLNNRKWTNESYLPQERIKCNFQITIDQDAGQNIYKATLTVQAARPVYNSIYESPVINFQDGNLTFRYVEFQPVEFNENRVQGSDPMAANLPAMLAYYVNIILGVDADSFAPGAGEPFFRKAQNIVNNAPEGRDISGWKTFDGVRNRFRLAENFTDSRYNALHEAYHAYYRQGMDQFYDEPTEARKGIIHALNVLNRLNTEIPNSMGVQFFFGGKSNELVRVFSKADPAQKAQARDLLLKLDVANATAYKELR